MGKRRVRLGVAAVVVALAVGAVGSAAGASGRSSKPRTIRVLAVISELNVLDTGASGPSLGDQIVFSNRLLDGQTEVGHEGAQCTTTSVVRNEALCTATFAFADGQISGQALVHLGDLSPYAVAITGGSGRYADARSPILSHF
jgi:hypothetical protein